MKKQFKGFLTPFITSRGPTCSSSIPYRSIHTPSVWNFTVYAFEELHFRKVEQKNLPIKHHNSRCFDKQPIVNVITFWTQTEPNSHLYIPQRGSLFMPQSSNLPASISYLLDLKKFTKCTQSQPSEEENRDKTFATKKTMLTLTHFFNPKPTLHNRSPLFLFFCLSKNHLKNPEPSTKSKPIHCEDQTFEGRCTLNHL